MAQSSRKIQIKFTGDAKGLRQASQSAESSFRGVSRSTEGLRGGLHGIGQTSAQAGSRLHRFGETADAVDTRAMGFHDSLTGVQDSMMGIGELAEGRTFQGLMLLGSGFSDLGSSVYNGLVPALKSAGTRLKSLRDAGSLTRSSLGKVGKRAGLVGIAFGTLLGATHALGAAFGTELNPEVSAMVDGLRQLANTGSTSGEIMRVLGQNYSDLGEAVDNTSQSLAGFQAWSESVLGIGDLFEHSVSKDRDRIKALDKALSQLDATTARRALKLVAKRAGLTKEQYRELVAELPKYKANQDQANISTNKAATALERQVRALKKATNPIFNLTSSLQQVGKAQKAYNKAVEKYGADSPQAQAASINLAKAIAGAEAAAKNGNLSFEAFRKKLGQWVDEGVITQGQANDIAGAVRNARGEAEKYQGTYNATLTATDRASGTINSLINTIAGFEGPHYATLTATTSVIGALQNGQLPHRASGGSVTAAQTYVVGERGPELFTPHRSGAIIPNNQLASSPVAVPTVGPDELRDALAGLEFVLDDQGGRIMAKLVRRANAELARR